MRASRAAPALSRRVLARGLSGKTGSPFAVETPPAPAADAPLSKEEEQRLRAEMVADVMREKTMREVSNAAAGRRPEGVKHMLDIEKEAADDAPQYAAKYDDDLDEWGGPKGERSPTPKRPCVLRGRAR